MSFISSQHPGWVTLTPSFNLSSKLKSYFYFLLSAAPLWLRKSWKVIRQSLDLLWCYVIEGNSNRSANVPPGMLLKSLPKCDQEKCDVGGRSCTAPIKRNKRKTCTVIWWRFILQMPGCGTWGGYYLHILNVVLWFLRLWHARCELRGF